MSHLITSANAEHYQSQIEQMHRLRWRVCIEERDWKALAEKQTRSGWECDEYDDARATYLMTLDRDGDLHGLVRMRPIDDRSLTFDHFPELIEEPETVYRKSGIWELTRLMRAPLSRSRDGAVRWESACAMIEFALSRQIHTLLASCDTFLVPMFRQVWGRNLRPLGLPTPYPEGEQIALAFLPTREMLATVRRLAGSALPRLYEHPPHWDADPLVEAAAFEHQRARRAYAPAQVG